MVTANTGLPIKGGGTFWATYTYNGDGQRVRRKTTSNETWQVYGMDGELVAEYPQTGPSLSRGQPTKEYGYRNGQLLVTAEQYQNIAYGKPATQTDDHASTTTANKAVDGDADGALWDNYASATNYHQNSWWQTDLQSVQTINSITVWGRTDCCQEMTTDFYVFVSDTPFTSYDLSTTIAQSGVWNYHNTGFAGPASIPVSRTGRYVRVQLAGTQYLVLGEVQVWSQAAKLEWMVADHLGTPRMIVDKTGSASGVSRHDYLPFGEEIFAGTGGRTSGQGYTSTDGERQQFTQKERDTETGLDYFGARYFASTQGRFTSYDPVFVTALRLVDPQRMNLYGYARNNPLKFVDPDGNDIVITAKNADDAKKKYNAYRIGFKEADRKHVHFFVGNGRNGYQKGQFYVLVDKNYKSDSGNFVAAQTVANDRKDVERLTVVNKGDQVKLLNLDVVKGRSVTRHDSFKFDDDFDGYTFYQYRGKNEGVGYSNGPYTETYVRGDQDEVEISVTMHHEMRAHVVLGDFGRNVKRGSHSDAYARGQGPATSEADKEADAAEKETRENATKKP